MEERLWSCREPYVDQDRNCLRYFYPNDDTTLYLYESYPMVVSPLSSVTNEHFVFWMRITALKHFRKLYSNIKVPIPPGLVLMFNVMATLQFRGMRGPRLWLLATRTHLGRRITGLECFSLLEEQHCLSSGCFSLPSS